MAQPNTQVPAFRAPLVHRFDPLDYEALAKDPVAGKVAALNEAVSYPPSSAPGAFSDQSLPRLSPTLGLILYTLAVGAVVFFLWRPDSALRAIPWMPDVITAILAGAGIFFVVRVGADLVDFPLPLAAEIAIVMIASVTIFAASHHPVATSLLKGPVLIVLTGAVAYGIALHFRAHLLSFTLNAPARRTDLLSTPQPWLVVFLPFVLLRLMPGVVPPLVLPWLAAVYLAHRSREKHRLPFRSIGRLLLSASESWLDYGYRGERAPGVFRSPAGSRNLRLLVTLLLILLIHRLATPFPNPTELRAAPVEFWLRVLGSLFVPLSILGSSALAFVATVLSDLDLLREEPDIPTLPLPEDGTKASPSDPDRWNLVTERLRRATSPAVRGQLLIGFHATENYPVFLPRETLREHASIVGATSAGKTSRVLLPLLSQLARIDEPQTETRGEDKTRPIAPRGPLVIIDLKGERYFFNAVRAEARRAERKFLYFSNHPHRGTHAFNPVLDLRELGILLQQVGATLHAGLNLEHGTGYGASYFSSVTRNYLANLLELAPEAESIAELYAAREKLRKIYPQDRERREVERGAAELISYLKALSARPELNVTSRSGDAAVFQERISMARALETDAVIYFNLFSKGEEAVARFVGSLALECLYAATYRYNEDPPPEEKGRSRKVVYAVVDEFQRIAGRNFGVFLEQARSAGLSLILAKQTDSLIEAELQEAVQTNTTYKHFFTFRSVEAVQAAGAIFGETAYYTEFQERLDHFLGPRFTKNDLRALSALPGYAASVQETSRDCSQFNGQAVAIYSPFHITKENRDDIESDPLPVGEPGTLMVGEQRAPQTTRPVPERVEPHPPRHGTELAASFERIHPTNEGYVQKELP